MKLIIENTSKIIQVNGFPARIWQGTTDTGLKVICFIPRVAVDESQIGEDGNLRKAMAQFESELKQVAAPNPEVQQFPLKMII